MVNMSNMKFQMNTVGGKPQIFFSQVDKQDKNSRKFGYKNREQRFPLRERAPEEEAPPPKNVGRVGASKMPGGRAGPGPGVKRPPITTSKKSLPSRGGTVTLTQEQLELILNSVGKTAASDRDNSVRISVGKKPPGERTEGGLSIEADAHRSNRRRRTQYSDDDEDSALGETADSAEEEERSRKRRPPPQTTSKPSGGGENIMGLLSRVDGGPKKTREPPGRGMKKPEPSRGRGGAKAEVGGGRGRGRGAPVKEKGDPEPVKKEKVSDEDVDQRMQRIIAENKNKMSEAELVDLLAAVYLDERQKQLQGREKEEKRQPRVSIKEEKKRRHYDDDDRGHRRPADRNRDSEEDLPRRKANRRPTERDLDSDEDEPPRRKTNRRPVRRRDYSDDDEDSHEEEERRRVSKRRQEPPRHRKPYSDSEEEETDRRGRHRRPENARRRKSPVESEEEERREKDEDSRPSVEAPRFLTMAEKKRLQWQKEREELQNLKTYDPWGRPGAGAPPKDSPSPPVLSKKEEEQQRYARELSEQLKEKRELQERQEAKRYGDSGEGGLANVDSAGLQLSGSFARGRGMANLDEKTRTDLEEQRKRQVEHQEAIKKQVEERQAKRAQERERKIREELEEEARLQKERDRLQRQFEDEQARHKRREVEHESRVAQLQAANEAAEQAAKIEKARRRMERLEGGGHDTSVYSEAANLRSPNANGLRANLEAELTARSQNFPTDLPTGLSRPAEVQMTTYSRHQVPGLEGIAEAETDRWATPRSKPMHPPVTIHYETKKEDSQAQTDASLLQPLLYQAMELAAMSTAQAHEEPVRRKEQRPPAAPNVPTQRKTVRGGKVSQRYQHGFVVEPESQRPPAVSNRPRHPIPVNERPKWGNHNTKGRRTLKQSEREVGDHKRQEREERRARRQAELMAKVEANQNRIPQRNTLRRREESPNPGYSEAPVYLGTYNLEGPETIADSWREPKQATGRISPPVPALRRGAAGGVNASEENLAGLLGKGEDLKLVRTSEILNPAKAERPLPVSREDTERQLARKTYYKGLNPAHFGDYMADLDDRRMEANLPNKTTNAKNPIFNPGIVKDIPTPRQDVILQHLSDIRKNLLQKQKEIETSLSIADNL